MAQSKKRATSSKKKSSVAAKPTSAKKSMPASTAGAGGPAGPRKGKAVAGGSGPEAPVGAAEGSPVGRARKASPAAALPPSPVAAPSAAPGLRKLPKGGPTKAEIRRYRAALLERRRVLLASTKDLASGALQGAGGEFSVDHMADHGSDNYEQDFNLKLLEGEAEQLLEIRDALQKADGLHELPFGLCEACADEDRRDCPTCPWIPASRLEVLPHARLCVAIQAREERSR